MELSAGVAVGEKVWRMQSGRRIRIRGSLSRSKSPRRRRCVGQRPGARSERSLQLAVQRCKILSLVELGLNLQVVDK